MLDGVLPCGQAHIVAGMLARVGCRARACAGPAPSSRGGAMPDSELMFRPALELAAMVRAGEISSRELVELSLERIDELNPALNAFVQIDAARALATADAIS